MQAAVAADGASASSAEPAAFVVPRGAGDDPLPRRPWSPLRENAVSYTSIAPSHDAEATDADAGALYDAATPDGGAPFSDDGDGRAARPSADADKATSLGSAFHRAAQFAVETGAVPDAARLAATADALALSLPQRARLAAACERWFGSEAFADALAWELRRAEVPFAVAVGDALMEGEIDLLCTHGPDACGPALVVDYKTGGSDDEDPARVREKHALQARCYAYALLSQGFDEVELRFVRVERAQGGGEPQVVVYRFSAADADALRALIVQARAASQA